MEALTDREGKQANTATETDEILKGEPFPPNENDQCYESPPAVSAHTCVTTQSLERVLHSQSVKKAPGPNSLSLGAIQLVWKWVKRRIVRLTRMAIRR